MRTPRFFLFLPILLALTFAVLLAVQHPAALAADNTSTGITLTPEVTIPGSNFVAGEPTAVTGTTIGEWISAVYVFLSGAMGIIAAVMVMWGGIKWVSASGNAGKVQDAKETIYSAILGLLLTLGAYVILRTINPQLVQIRDLSDLVIPISRIEQLVEAQLPKRVSEALFGNDPLTTEKNQFNALNCPTEEEMRAGFEVFLTGYYRPAFPAQSDLCKPSGGYQNFPCNVGMQCSCARGTACGVSQCGAGGLIWQPCDMNKFDQNNYCNHTASSTKPAGLIGGNPPFTAAASKCFGYGTTFTLSQGGSYGKVFTVTWGVTDRGGDITGRHLDLFMGTGDDARAEAVGVTGKATMHISRFCRTPDDCIDLTQP